MKARSVFAKLKKYNRFLYAVLFSSLLVACAEEQPGTSKPFLESATWNSQTNTLIVRGHLHGDGTRVRVLNKATGETVGSTMVKNEHYWKLTLTNPETIPCSIDAITPSVSDSTQVQNAPSDCNVNKVGSRALINSVGVTAGSTVRPLTHSLPVALIESPAQDLTIPTGTGLSFKSQAINPPGNGPVKYLWNFDGGAPNSTVQNPGQIVFSKPGIYKINLTAVNNAGSSPQPASRTITVLPGSSVQAAAPIANIDTPAGNMTVLVGESLFFSGSAFDPVGSAVLNYAWNFDGAAPNSNVQIPGIISFTQPGVYNISLTVTDAEGNRNMNPAVVQITVVNLLDANLPPTGNIIGPNVDVTVGTGTSIFFQGDGIDPDNNMPLTYMWDFGNIAPPSNLQNPGLVTFNTAGVYPISLLVIDSLGMADPNPPVRTITVNDTGVANSDFPDGMILSPPADMQINMGDTLVFFGQGIAAAGNDPVTYLWNFGDPGIPDSMEMMPGPITFTTAGVYEVSLTVTDAVGQTDPSPALRTITVIDPAAPPATTPGNGTLNGEIASPGQDITINAGTAIDFISDTDYAPAGATIGYFWNFGDMTIPDSAEPNPMGIAFNNVGVFVVTLIVYDDAGNMDETPAQRTITVVESGATADPTPPPANPTPTDPAASVSAPDGMILSPAGDVTIIVGDSLELLGIGADPNGSPLSYFWDIDGGPGNSTEQNPGIVTFTRVGNWSVELTVTNADGVSDPTPADIQVMVLPDPDDVPAPLP